MSKPAEQIQDLKDIVTTDFMKGIISEMNLDIDVDEEAMEDILGVIDKKQNDEEKPDENPDEDKKN